MYIKEIQNNLWILATFCLGGIMLMITGEYLDSTKISLLGVVFACTMTVPTILMYNKSKNHELKGHVYLLYLVSVLLIMGLSVLVIYSISK